MPRRKQPVKKTMRKQVRAVVKQQLAKELERKFRDLDVDPTSVPNGGANFYLNAVPDGTTVTERLGFVIRMKKLRIRGALTIPDAAIGSTGVRMILFRDNNQNDAIGNIDDLLESGTYRTVQQYTYNQMKRYQVLVDRRYTLDSEHENNQIKFDITLNRNMLIHFTGPGAGAYSKGTLILGFVSDSVDINNPPQVHFTSRLWFTDA